MKPTMFAVYEVDGTFVGKVQYNPFPFEQERHIKPYIEPDGFPCRDLYNSMGKFVGWIAEGRQYCIVYNNNPFSRFFQTNECEAGSNGIIASTNPYYFSLDDDGNFWKFVEHSNGCCGQIQKVGWLEWPDGFYPQPSGLSKLVGAALLLTPDLYREANYGRDPLWISKNPTYFRCKPGCPICDNNDLPYKGTVLIM